MKHTPKLRLLGIAVQTHALQQRLQVLDAHAAILLVALLKEFPEPLPDSIVFRHGCGTVLKKKKKSAMEETFEEQ